MTVLVTGIAEHGTVLIPAYMSFITAFGISAVVSRIIAPADKYAVFPDLIGYRGHMTAKKSGYLFKRLLAHNAYSDGLPVVKIDPFILFNHFNAPFPDLMDIQGYFSRFFLDKT